ncbi:MAG: hypothetical protein M3O34_01455 [Chloroflexota bacterium]|nr:hypothetical protein [Chloroflexota bacterium]
MIWQDLMLDRWVEEPALRAAAAAAFGVPVESVAVLDDVEPLTSIPDRVRVLIERTRQHRDFPLQLLIALRDDELAGRFGGFEGASTVGRALATTLGAAVLFAEGPLSPWEWVRVRPSGDLDVVSLDTEETGDVDSFFVVAERALADDGLAAEDVGPTRASA